MWQIYELGAALAGGAWGGGLGWRAVPVDWSRRITTNGFAMHAARCVTPKHLQLRHDSYATVYAACLHALKWTNETILTVGRLSAELRHNCVSTCLLLNHTVLGTSQR